MMLATGKIRPAKPPCVGYRSNSAEPIRTRKRDRRNPGYGTYRPHAGLAPCATQATRASCPFYNGNKGKSI